MGETAPRVTDLRPGIEAHPAGPAWLEQLSDPVMQKTLAGESRPIPGRPLEILFDLDVGVRAQAEAARLRFTRIESLNTSPRFIDALAAAVTAHLTTVDLQDRVAEAG